MSQEKFAVVRSFFDAYLAGDPSRAERLLDPQFEFLPSGTSHIAEPVVGRTEFSRTLADLADQFESYEVVPDRIIDAGGDRVVVAHRRKAKSHGVQGTTMTTMLRGGAIGISILVAAVLFAGCSDKTTGSTQTLTLTESNHGQFNTFGNVSQHTISPGGGFVISTPLLDSSKKSVGTLNAACIATKPSSKNIYGTCTATADVPNGGLSLNAGGTIGNGVSGSITGGTGTYAGATGTFTSSGGKTSTDTFHITLP